MRSRHVSAKDCPRCRPFQSVKSRLFVVVLFANLVLIGLPAVFAAPPRKAGELAITSSKLTALVEARDKLLLGTTGATSKPPSPKIETYHQLVRLAKAIETGGDFEELLTESAVGSGVMPRKWKVVVENENLKVEADVDGDLDGAAPLSEAIKRMQNSAATGAEVRIEQFEIVEMSLSKFATRAWFETRDIDTTQRCLWDIEWKPSETGVPLISEISGSRFTKTRSLTGGKLFAERTAAVLGSGPAVDQLAKFDGDEAAQVWVRQTGTRLSGVSVVDINGDGLDDIFVPQPGGIPNLLFVRQADGSLAEAAKEWGLDWADPTSSGLFVDMDNDGDRDLAVMTGQHLYVLANDGKQFSEKSKMDVASGALHALDYDSDGLVDLLVCDGNAAYDRNRVERPEHLHPQYTRGNLRLFHNNGELAFADTTKAAKLPQMGYAAAICDVDRNGEPDVFVTQSTGASVLFKNSGGTFTAGEVFPTATSAAIACGDLDRDGDDDCFVGNGWAGFLHDANSIDGGTEIRQVGSNSVLVQGSDKSLSKSDTQLNTGWTSSVQFADLDNSGSLDLIALNGFMTSRHTEDFADLRDGRAVDDLGNSISGLFQSRIAEVSRPTKRPRLYEMVMALRQGRSLAERQRNRVFMNTLDGKHLFADLSPFSGLDGVGDGRGFAVSDWDNDGDLDVWISNRNSPTLQFFENKRASDMGDSIQLELVGKSCNRDAIGATIVVELESGARLTRTVRAGEAYRSQSSHRVHFGIGKDDKINALVVRWPLPGKAESFTGVSAGGTYRLDEGAGKAEPIAEDHPEMPAGSGGALASVARNTAQDVFLPVRPIFPLVSYLTSEKEQRSRKEWAPGKPLLLVLWDPENELSAKEMRRLSKLRGLDCLALAPDAPLKKYLPTQIAKEQKFLNSKLDESKGFHKVGFFDDDFFDDLRVLHANVFSQPQTLRYPCSFLIDRDGRLAAVYRGQVDLKTVIGHFMKLKLTGDELVQASLPLGGKFVGEPPKATVGSLFADYLLSAMPGPAERIIAMEESRSADSGELLVMKSLLGEMYMAYQKFGRAQTLILEYLAAKPDDVVALNNFAVLSTKKGDEKAAEQAWKKACEADSTYPNAWANYGTFLMQRERYDDAEPIATRLLKISPDSIQAHNMISIIRLKDRKYKEAEEHLKTVIKLEPRAFGAYANLSKAYAIQNRLPEARKILERALAIDGIDDTSKTGLSALLERYQ